jgi:hypothetical protein
VRAAFPGDSARLSRMSLIYETGERFVRMAHLASVGSHCVNGVARMHSELLKQTVLHDFAELWPEKFCDVTNGSFLVITRRCESKRFRPRRRNDRGRSVASIRAIDVSLDFTKIEDKDPPRWASSPELTEALT